LKRQTARWRQGQVLLVEDDPGDQEITRRALRRDGFAADLRIVADGKEALDYLHRRGRFGDPADAPRPDLILLDLNLPGMSGKQLLETVKQDPALRRTPLVVVSTSAREQDIVDCYDLGCNSYVIKPLDAHRFIAELREIYEYWFGVVALPTR
jgi:CheY-like chemotaxis protein